MVHNINAVYVMAKRFTGKYGGDLISSGVFHFLKSSNTKNLLLDVQVSLLVKHVWVR